MKPNPLTGKYFKLTLAVGLTGISQIDAATTLGWDYASVNGNTTDETYGDNVTSSDPSTGVTATLGVDGFVGTPDIALNYNPNVSGAFFDDYPNWDGRGNVLQTDYLPGSPLALDFVPTAAVGVLINSFELDEFTGGGDSTVNWSILNGTTVIASGTWTDFNAASGNNGGRSLINTGMTIEQARANAGNPLTLNLDLVSGSPSYQALDNLSFDQVNAIPEPSSALLCLGGLGAAAMRRRRK